MKKFYDILKMTQGDLKGYLFKYLNSTGDYKVNSEIGYIYAVPKRDEIPVMVTAHMDTVHKNVVSEIVSKNVENEMIISSPQGIGGDDRCGVWIIMNLVRNGFRPHILFCEDEEKGCVGAELFCDAYKDNVYIKTSADRINYMIEIDRRGKNDCVFYSCDNKEFIEWIEKETGYETAIGSCSDISVLMRTLKVSGVNFSCGYHNEHTLTETININEMDDTFDMLTNLLILESKRYEYVEKKYSYANYYRDYYDDDYGWRGYGYGGYASSSRIAKTQKKKSFSDIKVTLIAYTEDGSEYEYDGDTKPEAWMNFFMENPDICFNDVLDYEYL